MGKRLKSSSVNLSFTLLLLLFSISAVFAHQPIRKQPTGELPSMVKYLKNEGQWEPAVQYRADLPGGRVWLTDAGFTYQFHDRQRLHDIHDKYVHDHTQRKDQMNKEMVDIHSFRVNFLGANPNPGFSASGPSSEYYNFFIGAESTWRSDIHAMEKVSMEDVYTGIDLDVYSKGTSLKYDFIVSPGANANAIRLGYEGMNKLSLHEGRLQIGLVTGLLEELAPYAYQVVNGTETKVECHFTLQGNEVGFDFPNGYDANLPLVIDPTLVGATYSGSTTENYGHTAAHDDQGNMYSAGIAFGTGFPVTVGAFQITYGGFVDHGINKYAPDASALIWSTYLGGSDGDYPHSMIANDLGELIVLGSTSSNNYPVSASAYQSTLNGFQDISITHLNATATGIVGSSYLGGSAADGTNAWGLAVGGGDYYRGEVIVDAAGDIYIANTTESNDFPVTTGALQSLFGGQFDGVVVKMTPDLSTLTWSTFLGGTLDDCALSLRIATNGEIYVAGATQGSFPATAGAFQAAFQGGTGDAYMARISSNGQTLLSATYAGTNGMDVGYFVDLDDADLPHLMGRSDAYPVTGGVYSQTGGELFMQKFNADLSASPWSTTIGSGASGLNPTGFLVDLCGNLYMSAWGNTVGLPMTPNAIDPVGGSEFYLMALTPNAGGLLYGTSYGADNWDHVDGGTCRFDKNGTVYISVCTDAANWPTTANAVFPTDNNGWGYDVACYKFAFELGTVNAIISGIGLSAGCAPANVNFQNNSSQGSGVGYQWDFGNGGTSTSFNPSTVYNNPGTYTVTLIVTDSNTCNIKDTAYATVTVSGGISTVNLGTDTVDCSGNPITLGGAPVPDINYIWSTGDTTSSIVVNTTGTYWLTATDSCGNVFTDTINVVASNNPFTIDLGLDTLLCEGSTVPLNAGAGFADYSWSNGDSTQNINVTTSGIYSVIVTDALGCTASDQIEIEFTEPTAVGNVTDATCNGLADGEISVTAAGYSPFSYQWSDPNLPPSSNVSGLLAGSYVITVTDSLGCATSLPFTLLEPTPVTATISGNDTICTGEALGEATASPAGGTSPYTLTWSNGDTGLTADSLTGGTVLLTVTDDNGCQTSESFTVTELPPGLIPLTVWDTVCIGFDAVLQAVPPAPGGQIHWYYSANSTAPFQTGPTLHVPVPDRNTVYYAGFSLPGMCPSPLVAAHAMVNAPPNIPVTFSDTEVEIPEATVIFDADIPNNVVDWIWTLGDGTVSQEDSLAHTYQDVGQYDVTFSYTDENGCQNRYEWPLWITVTDNIYMYIPNAFTPNGEGPEENNTFNIAHWLIADFNIMIFDRWGKLLYESNDLEFQWNGQDVSGQPLPEGVYIYKIDATTYKGAPYLRSGSVTLLR